MEPPVGSSSVAESGVVQPIPRKNPGHDSVSEHSQVKTPPKSIKTIHFRVTLGQKSYVCWGKETTFLLLELERQLVKSCSHSCDSLKPGLAWVKRVLGLEDCHGAIV